MAKGYFGRWPDDQLRSYGKPLTEAADAAAAAVGGWNTHTIRVGRSVLALRTIDPTLHALFVRATWHLTSQDAATITISVCDAATASAAPPDEPSWTAEYWRHEGAETVLYFDRDLGTVSWSDTASRNALWWIPSAAAVPPWERPAPLRTLIDRLVGPTGATLVHAGVVGDDHGGVLMAGRGGSGKSTSIVMCVASGLCTGGDDFLLVEHGDVPPTARSLYATARLVPTSPAWAHFTPDPAAIEVPIDAGSEDVNLSKRTVYLGEQFPGRVRDSFEIRAVVIPTVTVGETRLSPIRPAQALLALAPSSMLQLDPRASALRAIADLVGQVPCFGLDLGSDTEQVPPVIHSLLRRSAP